MKFTKTISGISGGRSRGLRGPIQIRDRYLANEIAMAGRQGKAVPIGWLYDAFVIPDHIHEVLSCLVNEKPYVDEYGTVGHVEILWKDDGGAQLWEYTIGALY